MALATAVALFAFATGAAAQQRDDTSARRTVTAVPGPMYEAGAFTRAIAGSGWRDVWTTAIQAPVLDLETYAGGLKLEERGGGFHSLVLHLEEENGWREYRFRSVQKFPMQGLPPALRGTAVGRIFQDQVSILFPAAPILVPPVLEAVGVLHVDPDLYVMGDSPRLEQQRDSVRGMLGTMELKGKEAPDDKPGFAGSSAIKDTEDFYEDLASGRQHRLDEREFLVARLIDFLINDPDRTLDNFDWARFGEKGAYTWRPLPRDRDQAFINARGLLNRFVMRRFYPKQVEFKREFDLRGLTYSTHTLDRRLLQRLSAQDFRQVAQRVQRAIPDSVIALVIAELPAPWRARTTADEEITTVLRWRRDHLPDVAMEFYRDLATEVDVRGTDDADRFDVFRHPDGRVTVTAGDPERAVRAVARRPDGSVVITSDGAVSSGNTIDHDVFYARTFLPSETNEVRLFLEGGNDVAVVRGARAGAIKVRIIGGKGDDTLADSVGGATSLYDAEGRNALHTSAGTRVSTRPWKELEFETGFRIGGDWRPDWGKSTGWGPALDYSSDAGVIVGVGPRFTSYGFRRLPHHWRVGANFLVGTLNGRLGLTLDADYRMENSPRHFRVNAQATQLESTRFFGYGNDSPDVPSDLSHVDQTMITAEPAMVWQVGWRAREKEGNPLRGRESTRYSGLRPVVGAFSVGPVAGWIDPDPAFGSPLQLTNVAGTNEFGFVGAKAALELDRTDFDAVPTSGWRVKADVSGYPAAFSLPNSFAAATAGGSLYVPLKNLGGPHIALRARGAVASDGYPVQFSPALGGRSTLRGFAWRRYAGDAALNGGAELRVPVGTVNFLIRSQVGLFALADAGRVWFDGSSDGGWHAGYGGGFWLAALGQSVSFAYAYGEEGKLYLKKGLFF